MNAIDVKKRIDSYIQENCEKYILWGKELQLLPETGFCEIETNKYINNKLRSMGLDSIEELPVTGCIARLKGANSKKSIAVMAELDAVFCPGHKLANHETGMAHVCGHNAQLAMLLCVADAFSSCGVMGGFDGDIVFIAVPAEESIREDVFKRLSQDGKIVYKSGKQELIRLGRLKGLDAALSIHAYTTGKPISPRVMLQTSCNGFAAIECNFIGKAAHTAEAPHEGINALSAAVLAINALQAIRETFKESEYLRLSYILTQGGVSVSTVPDLATLTVQIRAKRMEKLEEMILRIETILKSAATMIGAKCDITTKLGYKPYIGDDMLLNLVAKNANALGFEAIRDVHGCYCTDLGDVSQLVPTAHFSLSGYTGQLHGEDFMVDDETMAYITPARVMSGTLIDLLGENQL